MIIKQAIEKQEYFANTKNILAKLGSLKKTFAISTLLTIATGLLLFFTPQAFADNRLDISAFTVKTNPDGTQDYSLS